ncbi:hypothetical protein Bbelb_130040 [Branchiostoma belcheri]|nr:hypothetical protein Bbelb_130040 [Branchiostoma belcheri]
MRGKALVSLLLLSTHLHVVRVSPPCPSICTSYRTHSINQKTVACRCPHVGKEQTFPCLLKHGGGTPYNSSLCLAAIPTGFHKDTRRIIIVNLNSSTLLRWSFPNISSRLEDLTVTRSNVAVIQPGAFLGLPSLTSLNLAVNRISRLEDDTFFGLQQVTKLLLFNNMITSISRCAFRGMIRMKELRLNDNQLTSVPVMALLQPKALETVALERNRISTIHRNVMNLKQNPRLKPVRIANNNLRCDGNLTWFICCLTQLRQIASPGALECASPDDYRGTALATMRKGVCQTNTNNGSQEETGSTTYYGESVTSLYIHNQDICTEDSTEWPFTDDMSISQHTTEIDIVVILEGDSVINMDVNSMQTWAMIGSAVLPLLLVASSMSVLFIFKRSSGTGLANDDQRAGTDDEQPPTCETVSSQRIEPYAVVYPDSIEPQAAGINSSSVKQTSPAQGQSSGDEETIQPYAVAYGEDQGQDSEIKPYAVAYKNDSEQNDGHKITSYALGCSNTPQDAGGHTEADSAPNVVNITNREETTVKQPVARPDEKQQRTVTDARPKNGDGEAEDGDPSTRARGGKGPYEIEEDTRIPSASNIYRNGPRHGDTEQHSTPHIIYTSPTEVQTSKLTVLYEDFVDTGPLHN